MYFMYFLGGALTFAQCDDWSDQKSKPGESVVHFNTSR